jgi:hypothetical protein
MSSVNRHNLAPQRTVDTQHNVKNAALHGATLAFSKPPPKPAPLVNTYTGSGNGALLAATKVGSPQHGVPAGSPSSLKADYTGGSLRNRPNASRSSSSQSLAVPDDHLDRGSSPSNIAARLAAARHSPLRPTPQASASMTSERHANERDVLPPSGSVGNMLARMETRQPPPKRRDSLSSQSVANAARAPMHDHRPTDDTPIPPTTSLVKMFEQGQTVPPTKPVSVPLSIAQHSPPPVRSPKPQRAFRLPPEPQDDAPLARQRTRTPPPVKPKPQQRIELPPPQYTDGAPYFRTPQKEPMKSPPIKQKPVQLTPLRTSTPPPPKAPSQRGSRQARPQSEDIKRSRTAQRRTSTSIHSEKEPESPASFKSAKEMQEAEGKLKPELPPPRRSNPRKMDAAPAATRPRSAAPVPIPQRRHEQLPMSMLSPTRLSPPRRPTSTGTSPASVYHNPYQRDSVRQITKHMTGESLSSAIMGAALASSRNASPAPAQPFHIEPLFPPRKQQHHHLPFHRSPSPPKQSPPKATGKLRTTMRKDPSSSEDEDEVEKYKKKGSRILGMKQRKHPNKHHEGERKRWRDQITERERKRYEGVWAANKGLFLPSTSPAPQATSSSPGRAPIENDISQDVLNLVVHEIWLRSRLPIHVLEEVWDLVDSRAIGRLKRDEFVVGLWLIDQRLKGRKLPVKVTDSVWASVRGTGIKVKVRG